jgi:hypothetical protein
MRIENAAGYYLVEATATFSDAEALIPIFTDWPGQVWKLDTALNRVSTSAQRLNDTTISKSPVDSIGSALFFLRNSADETLGAIEFSWHQNTRVGSPSGFQVYRAAISPAYRGLGHFSTLYNLIVYFAHCFLGAEEATIATIDTAPQVTHKLEQNSVARAGSEEVIPDLYTQKEVVLEFDDFHPTLGDHQHVDISIKVGGTVLSLPTRKV